MPRILADCYCIWSIVPQPDFPYATQQKHPETIQIQRTEHRGGLNTKRKAVVSLLVAIKSLYDLAT